ncbi:MAG TPA: hypothetical protein VFW15_13760 [Thermoanaerobaculia bacterium]|nr:hypothetical protein [Thermoanaerobaculia bacterium]
MKNTFALDRERWDGFPGSATARRGFPLWPAGDADAQSARQWTAAGAGPQGLSPRLLWGALAGELVAAIILFASGSVSPVLVRSLQFFLRF